VYAGRAQLTEHQECAGAARGGPPSKAGDSPPGAIKKGMDAFWTPSLGVGFGGLKSRADDVAYKITKAVMEGQEYQRAAFNGVADDMIKCTMEQSISPLQAGAIKYYREKGAKIPEALIPPEAK
jgi:uncharacterized protein